MQKIQKIHVKIGDTVKIISGSDKNKTGEVIKIYHKTGKLIVKGINFKFKHVKPRNDKEIGEIKQFQRILFLFCHTIHSFQSFHFYFHYQFHL